MCKFNTVLAIFISFLALSCADPSGDKDPIDLSVDVGWGDDQSKSGEDGGAKTDIPVIPPKAEVRIVTFNVRKYFDATCDSGRCDVNDFEQVFVGAEFAFRGNQLADALKTLDADIIVMQELETEECIDVIADRLGFDHRAFGETFSNASLDVGIISKFEITAEKRYRDSTTLELATGGTKKFTREFLETEISVEGEKVLVFAAHFKSKSSDNPAWREAEAKAAQKIVVERAKANPNALVVLGGDLNDSLDSPALKSLTESGDLIAAGNESSWTYQYNGEKDQIDHLIYANFSNINLTSIKAARSANGRGFSVSDHAALVATFEIR